MRSERSLGRFSLACSSAWRPGTSSYSLASISSLQFVNRHDNPLLVHTWGSTQSPLLLISKRGAAFQKREAPRSRPVAVLEEEEEEEVAAPLVPVQKKEKQIAGRKKKTTASKEEEKVKEEQVPTEPVLKERIAKRLARSGICSRRDAEDLIREGRVMIDGVITRTPAVVVTPKSEIKLDGKMLPRPPDPKIWLHYKKKGVVITHKDPEGRLSLFSWLKHMGFPYVVSVGRLDFASEGLLVLTNLPGLAHYLEHPANCHERKYKVRIRGELTETMREKLAQGVRVKGVDYGPIKASLLRRRKENLDPENKAANQWLLVTLGEGKNREIRKVFQHFNLTVTRIVRTHYGPFKLKKSMIAGDTLEIDVKEPLLKKAGEEHWWMW